tara:strand:+ start:234 stop:998 length:765 start_codon:yes stop_codon:yes gene_type:complete
MERKKPVKGDSIAVWFSCGAASAVAAKKTLELYRDCDVTILNSPIAEEDDDNRRFLSDVEKWLNKEIKIVKSDKYVSQSAVEVWETKRFMSSIAGAPCTVELKKYPRQNYEQENKVDWNVLGFTVEEKNRAERFMLTERDNLLPVLINENISKVTCMEIINSAGISLPRVYKMGYPNANCIGCVKATSPTYWNLVRKTHPSVFDHRAKQSRDIGVKLTRVNGERIFLDELDPNAFGEAIKDHLYECGLFCEENN